MSEPGPSDPGPSVPGVSVLSPSDPGSSDPGPSDGVRGQPGPSDGVRGQPGWGDGRQVGPGWGDGRQVGPGWSEAPIVLERVSHWYGNVVAVNDVSFSVGPGVTGLLGPNGAGKTTLLHMAAGMLAPSSGQVRVAGAPA